MKLDINKATLKELQGLKSFSPKSTFREIIIVPKHLIHDSGFSCMKYILMNDDEVVGVINDTSDIVHLNGIGGYGKNINFSCSPKGYGWRVDCLRESKCIRLFCDKDLSTNYKYFGASDFMVFVEEEKERTE